MAKEKVVLTPKFAQKVQEDIYYNMSAEGKIRILSKIYMKISKMARNNLILKYPNINSISFIRKLHEDLSLGNRKIYENLFERFLKETIKNTN